MSFKDIIDSVIVDPMVNKVTMTKGERAAYAQSIKDAVKDAQMSMESKNPFKRFAAGHRQAAKSRKELKLRRKEVNIRQGRTWYANAARRLGYDKTANLLDKYLGTAKKDFKLTPIGTKVKKPKTKNKDGTYSEAQFGDRNNADIKRIHASIKDINQKLDNLKDTGELDQKIDGINEKLDDLSQPFGNLTRLSEETYKKVFTIENILETLQSDMTAIKDLIAPKGITAKNDAGDSQFIQYSPLAPQGEQFRQVSEKGNALTIPPSEEFMKSAIQQAAIVAARGTLELQKKKEKEEKSKLTRKFIDPNEKNPFRLNDPIVALRIEMLKNFKKLFDLLKKSGIDGTNRDGGGGLPVPPIIVPPRVPGGGGGRGPRKRGGGTAKSKARYARRYGKKAAAKRFGKAVPKKGGGLLGVGGMVGGFAAYSLIDTMRDENLETYDPEQLKADAIAQQEAKDAAELEKTRKQIADQKKDVKIQAAASGGAIAGGITGQIVSNRMWNMFVKFVQRRAPTIFARVGARLATAGVLATVPIIGWVSAAITLGFTVWMAYDLWTLWQEFSRLSAAEKEAYANSPTAEELAEEQPKREGRRATHGPMHPRYSTTPVAPPPPIPSVGDTGIMAAQTATVAATPLPSVADTGTTITQAPMPSVMDTGVLKMPTRESKEIPPEGRAFLDALSIPESRGDYRAMVGNGNYGGPKSVTDFSKHPAVAGVGLDKNKKWVHVNSPEKVLVSTAAGKYQITHSTWKNLRTKYPDLKDFSPENQDKAAWYLARDDYKAKTKGGDLLTDLRAGNFKKITTALNSTWTSLAGGAEAQKVGGVGETQARYNTFLAKQNAQVPGRTETYQASTTAPTPSPVSTATVAAIPNVKPSQTTNGAYVDQTSKGIASQSGPTAMVAALQPIIVNNTQAATPPVVVQPKRRATSTSTDSSFLNALGRDWSHPTKA